MYSRTSIIRTPWFQRQAGIIEWKNHALIDKQHPVSMVTAVDTPILEKIAMYEVPDNGGSTVHALQ